MLQSLIGLEDDQIEIVLAAVTQWCKEHNVLVDSAAGRRVIIAAVDVVSNHRTDNFSESLSSRLNELRGERHE